MNSSPSGEFRAPRTMTPTELGDTLARLVWESFSDFIEEGDPHLAPAGGQSDGPDGFTEQEAAEEALIFFMWAHTRGTRLAFIGRTPEELIRRGLDLMQDAVFDDMVRHGTPAGDVPLFEERVRARYSEYAAAAGASDATLGRAVACHLTGSPDASESAVRAVAERAILVASPLRDFLSDVELTP